MPVNEAASPVEREFVIEAILAFPELDSDEADHDAVPEFFRQMACDEDGRLKCRLSLEARWIDDGSLDGLIEQNIRPSDLSAHSRTEIALISDRRSNTYPDDLCPRDPRGSSQVTAFLRGRLWRAITWSTGVKQMFAEAAGTLNKAFGAEPAVDFGRKDVERRWQEVHSAGTDAKPVFRPVDLRFQEFIRKVEVVFHPDEAGRTAAWKT